MNHRLWNASVGIPGIDPSCSGHELCAEKRLVLGESVGQMNEMLANSGADRFEPRQEIVTDSIAKMVEIPIRAVLLPVDTTLFEPRADLSPGPWQEGSNDIVGRRCLDPRECAGAAAPKELDEHTFSDIVTMVTGRDSRKAIAVLEIDEGTIPETAPGALSSRAQWSAWLDSQEMEWDVELSTQSLAESGVLVRLFAAHPVVDVGRLENQREVILPQEMQQGGRVSAAREGDQHPSSHQPGEGGAEVFSKSCQGHASS
jgi:hypothetical protein